MTEQTTREHFDTHKTYFDETRRIFRDMISAMQAVPNLEKLEPLNVTCLTLPPGDLEDMRAAINTGYGGNGPVGKTPDKYGPDFDYPEDLADQSHKYIGYSEVIHDNVRANIIQTSNYPDNAEEIEQYLRFTLSEASSEEYALAAWKQWFGSIPLVRRDVIHATTDVNSLPDKFFNSVQIPTFRTGGEAAEDLAGATINAQNLLGARAKAGGVYEYLDSLLKDRPKIGRDINSRRLAPLLAMSEALITEAQVISLVAADSPLDISIPKLMCDLARKNVFDRIALCMPGGIIGPFGMRGIAARGGLIEIVDGTYQLTSEFEKLLVKRSGVRKAHIARTALKGSSTPYLDLMDTSTDHPAGFGCPVVAKPEPGETTPIDFTLQLLAQGYDTLANTKK